MLVNSLFTWSSPQSVNTAALVLWISNNLLIPYVSQYRDDDNTVYSDIYCHDDMLRCPQSTWGWLESRKPTRPSATTGDRTGAFLFFLYDMSTNHKTCLSLFVWVKKCQTKTPENKASEFDVGLFDSAWCRQMTVINTAWSQGLVQKHAVVKGKQPEFGVPETRLSD